MGHLAFMDPIGAGKWLVTEVITGRNEDEVVDGISDWEEHYGQFRGQKCVRTSYNTRGGVNVNGGNPLRKNFAGIGFTYDENLDAFIPPKPFESWLLNEETCLWESPTPMPTDGAFYTWNETTQSWDAVPSE